MKKNFFYFAFAAVAAISLTACSSDDDSNDGGSTTPTVNLPRPANAGNAAVYTLAGGGVTSSTTAQGEEHAPVLNSLEVTESEQVLFQITQVDNTPFYVIDRPTVVGNTFTFNSDKVKGTVQRIERVAATRQGMVEYALILSLTIYNAGNPIEFKTAPEGVPATKQPTPAAYTDDNTTISLCRTWNFVTGNLAAATFDVHVANSNTEAFKEFYAQNDNQKVYFDLEKILNEALERDVALSQKDRDDMKRKIKNITVTADEFIIAYADSRGDDVANWSWVDSQQKKTMKIQLKNNKMGNKFFNNDTKIGVEFNGNRCNLKLEVLFADDNGKQWNSSLTVHMQYVE